VHVGDQTRKISDDYIGMTKAAIAACGRKYAERPD
jgi:hypothetical protein